MFLNAKKCCVLYKSVINFIQTLYRGCTENDFAFFAVVSALLRVCILREGLL